MILINDEITLNAIELEHETFLREMINDPNIEKFVLGWSKPVSKQEQIKWIENLPKSKNEVRYLITQYEIPVGMASITSIDFINSNASLNVKLHTLAPKRKGIATKSMEILIKYCFNELNLNSLYVNILDYNLNSKKLFEKLGFKQEGRFSQKVYKSGEYHDVLYYTLLKKDYNK